MSADFLLDPGTNGFIATPFNLLSTELNALASASTATSSVGGSSGVFTQTNFANAQKCFVFFESGGAFTPTAAGNLAIWWLQSDNGGTNFEFTVSNTALPRAPDAIIPLYASAYASGGRSWSPICRAPWPSCKIYVQNNAGVALPATGNLILAAPVAERY